jgi:hypothetical protein
MFSHRTMRADMHYQWTCKCAKKGQTGLSNLPKGDRRSGVSHCEVGILHLLPIPTVRGETDARVSIKDQSLYLQIDALKQAQCEQVFIEVASGGNTARPVLTDLLSHLRATCSSSGSSTAWAEAHSFSRFTPPRSSPSSPCPHVPDCDSERHSALDSR